MFRQRTLLHVFELAHDLFAASTPGKTGFLEALKLLVDCLKLHSLKLDFGPNTMAFRIAMALQDSPETIIMQKLQSFCEPKSIRLIITRYLLDTNFTETEKVAELVRSMLEATSQFNMSSKDPEWCLLLTELYKVTTNGKLQIGSLSSLMR